MKEKQLVGKVTPAWVRKKWENLKQKYKVMLCINLTCLHKSFQYITVMSNINDMRVVVVFLDILIYTSMLLICE